MGLFDLPGPLFGLIDHFLAMALPAVVRLGLWGVLAGWLTMIVYRRLSNQDKIQALKAEQKFQQKEISEFDGEMRDLFPLIRHTLGLGMRQLALSLGPALLATIPVLFLLVWVAGHFGHEAAVPGSRIAITVPGEQRTPSDIVWQPGDHAVVTREGWNVIWPAHGETLRMSQSGKLLLELPTSEPIPIIHKERWWNLLMANPIGYLPEDSPIDAIEIGLKPQVFLAIGPDWIRGWMFTFFLTFLLSSVVFKVLFRID